MTWENKIIDTKQFGGKLKITTQYCMADRNVQLAEIHALLDYVTQEAKHKKNWRVMVRGLAIDKWTTLKTFKDDMVTFDEYSGLLLITIPSNFFKPHRVKQTRP